MEDSKKGILPLVGRVIRKRLGEATEEARRELREGFDEFGRELEEELEGGKEAPARSRIQVEEE